MDENILENLVHLIYVPKVPDSLYIFGTKLKKEKKYMKMCKNKKYSKGVPFGVLVKNMK